MSVTKQTADWLCNDTFTSPVDFTATVILVLIAVGTLRLQTAKEQQRKWSAIKCTLQNLTHLSLWSRFEDIVTQRVSHLDTAVLLCCLTLWMPFRPYPGSEADLLTKSERISTVTCVNGRNLQHVNSKSLPEEGALDFPKPPREPDVRTHSACTLIYNNLEVKCDLWLSL